MGDSSSKETVDAKPLEPAFGETAEVANAPEVLSRETVFGRIAGEYARTRAANTLPRGSTIGRFVVIDVLGSGAAGVVYKAYDPTLGREIALKLLQAHGLGPVAHARLLDEARAMARVSHPNVVTVHEVAVEDDQVILAMECVAGCTLWEWTRDQDRPWRSVVAAYREAGRGLAAAHAAGLVHRDFKPANVLVGDDARIRVTDFGIATSLGEVDTAAPHDDVRPSAQTRFDRIVGTPWYMAPEQHRGAEVDERSDQYAFCLALWEALCGASPFDGQDVVELEEAKLKGPPPWPKHVAVPSRIAEAIRRGLAPAPEARFPDMAALLEQLAYDPASRRRRWLAAAALTPALALAGGWAWAWQAERAKLCSGATEHLREVWNDERRAQVVQAIAATGLPYATPTGSHAVRVLDAYGQAWATQFTQTCEATAIRAEQSQATMDLRMACLHRNKLELQATVNVLAAADPQVVERAATMVENLPPLAPCEDLHAGTGDTAAPPTPEDAARIDEIEALLADANALSRAAKYEDALSRVEKAEAVLGDAKHLPIAAETALRRGIVEDELGRHAEAEATWREALRLALRSGFSEQASKIASSLANNLAAWQERPDEARWLAEIAWNLASEREYALAQVAAVRSLALVLYRQGKYAESEAESRRALELERRMSVSEHLTTSKTQNLLAVTLSAQGREAEAEALHRELLSAHERTLGPDHPLVGDSTNNLATVLLKQQRRHEALELFRRTVTIYEHTRGPKHAALVLALGNEAGVLLHLRRLAEAEDVLRRAVAIAEGALERDHPQMSDLRSKLAWVLVLDGKYEDADEQLRQALASMQRSQRLEHPYAAGIFDIMGISALRQGDPAKAEVHLRRSISMREKSFGATSHELAGTRQHLARALAERGDRAQARQLLEQAWVSIAQVPFRPDKRADIAFDLAKLLASERDERARALELARTAATHYREAGEPWTDELAEVEAWLAQRR